jgi:hypothetical protein
MKNTKKPITVIGKRKKRRSAMMTYPCNKGNEIYLALFDAS